jgi:hypothetical protein
MIVPRPDTSEASGSFLAPEPTTIERLTAA